MDALTDDDLFVEAVGAIALDALARIGACPIARFALIKNLPVAQAATVSNDRNGGRR